MKMIKFLYDLVIYLTTHYSELPEDFRSRFPESQLINFRQVVFDLYTSETNDFDDYE